MTDIEVIEKILKTNNPTQLFGGDWKTTYKKYSRLIHPDACRHHNASDAMAKLNYLKDLIEYGIQYRDETGDFNVFDKKIIYKITNDNRKLIRKSYDNYIILKSKRDKASLNFHRYLPDSMKIDKDNLVITLKDRVVPLTNQELPQVHVNWIFSRIFELTLWFSQVGYSHMGINPTTVMVVPETHGIIITSFYHMTPLNQKAGTISAMYKTWYPTTLFSKKIATVDVDLELGKKIALYLLGDRSAAGTILKRSKDVNQQILTFLITKHQNIMSEYKEYRELFTKNFKKKFYSLDL